MEDVILKLKKEIIEQLNFDDLSVEDADIVNNALSILLAKL